MHGAIYALFMSVRPYVCYTRILYWNGSPVTILERPSRAISAAANCSFNVSDWNCHTCNYCLSLLIPWPQ